MLQAQFTLECTNCKCFIIGAYWQGKITVRLCHFLYDGITIKKNDDELEYHNVVEAFG